MTSKRKIESEFKKLVKKARLARGKEEFFQTELVGEISVESGQIVIGDPCYLENLKFDEVPMPGGVHQGVIAEVVNRTGIRSFDQPELRKLFNRPCADITGADLNEPVLTEEEKAAGLQRSVPQPDFKLGVVSRTNGDGTYDVFATTMPSLLNPGGRDIVSLTIRFQTREHVEEVMGYLGK